MPLPLAVRLLAALAVAVALAGGLVLGRATAGGPPRPGEVELGFVRDMSAHHAQAVEMAEVAHRRAADPALRHMAFDVLSTQQGQIGLMQGWLDVWQAPRAAGEPMAWAGHEGPMPGLATRAQIARLDTLPVPEMEEEYLRLMIRHHRGALPMADVAVERAEHPLVSGLARQVALGQGAEIDAMQELLRARGAAPEPAAGHDGHG